MHDVEAHVTWTALAEHCVEVGSIVVEQAAALVYKTCNLGNLCLEYTEGVGVCHHDAGNSVIKQRLEVLNINGAVGC